MIYVDFPNADGGFDEIESFKTKRAAIAWLREIWGEHAIDDNGNLCLISGNDEKGETANDQ